jgi:AcrR family transcriptional regulator
LSQEGKRTRRSVRNVPQRSSNGTYGTGKDRLLESAIELFGRNGFAGTSVRSIAEHAGVSFALIRENFGSKEGLREAAERAVMSEWRNLFAFSGDPSSEREVSEYLRAHADDLARLRPHIRFIRRAILEDRPIANAFLKWLYELNAGMPLQRLRAEYPHESFLFNPMFALILRAGYFLVAPSVEEIWGRDTFSLGEVVNINVEGARVLSLVTKGLEAERRAAAVADKHKPRRRRAS